jgi:putative ABC transport system substrate-binding protein
MLDMRRRECITLLGGAAVAWPVAARAQRAGMRRIGVFTNLAADDPESQARIGAFLQGLQQSGWTIRSNVRIDYRWETTDIARYHQYAADPHHSDRIRGGHRPGRRRLC